MKSLPTYSSFLDKEKHFRIKIIDDIDTFKDVLETLKVSSGIFRGISSSNYKIYTSLQRQVIQNELSGFSLEKYVDAFRKKDIFKRYFSTFKIPPSKLSIYSFLQHYSAPTPYLDFTSKVGNALYFAIEGFDATLFTPQMDIRDYFSIFFIDRDDINLIAVPEVIEGLRRAKQSLIDYLKHYEDYSEEGIVHHIDGIFSLKTLPIFLIDNNENLIDVYNTYNNIRIIAQDGLFIHNGYNDIPLEEGLKLFFKDSTIIYPSPWDEMTPEIAMEKFEEDLEISNRNKQFQDRLESNIIRSFEINKKLIPDINKIFNMDRQNIYPDPEKICWEIFDSIKNSSAASKK